MDPLTIGLLIAGGTSLIGSWINSRAQKKANETNVQLARESQAFDTQQMDKANLYNAPATQMLRLQQAKLNPNLVYGSGNVVGNQSGVVKATPKRVDPVNFAMPDLTSKLQAYYDMKSTQATTDNTRMQTELTEEKIRNEWLNREIKNVEKETGIYDLRFKKKLENVNIANKELSLEKINNEINQQLWELNTKNPLIEKGIGYDAGLKQLEYELNSKLKPYGLSQHDSYIWKAPAIVYERLKGTKGYIDYPGRD